MLPDDPQPGDDYELILWDLWHHWFGIAAARKTRSFQEKWKPEDRKKYIERLKTDLKAEGKRARIRRKK
jgi:hypothetical protein